MGGERRGEEKERENYNFFLQHYHFQVFNIKSYFVLSLLFLCIYTYVYVKPHHLCIYFSVYTHTHIFCFKLFKVTQGTLFHKFRFIASLTSLKKMTIRILMSFQFLFFLTRQKYIQKQRVFICFCVSILINSLFNLTLLFSISDANVK